MVPLPGKRAPATSGMPGAQVNHNRRI